MPLCLGCTFTKEDDEVKVAIRESVPHYFHAILCIHLKLRSCTPVVPNPVSFEVHKKQSLCLIGHCYRPITLNISMFCVNAVGTCSTFEIFLFLSLVLHMVLQCLHFSPAVTLWTSALISFHISDKHSRLAGFLNCLPLLKQYPLSYFGLKTVASKSPDPLERISTVKLQAIVNWL